MNAERATHIEIIKEQNSLYNKEIHSLEQELMAVKFDLANTKSKLIEAEYKNTVNQKRMSNRVSVETQTESTLKNRENEFILRYFGKEQMLLKEMERERIDHSFFSHQYEMLWSHLVKNEKKEPEISKFDGKISALESKRNEDQNKSSLSGLVSESPSPIAERKEVISEEEDDDPEQGNSSIGSSASKTFPNPNKNVPFEKPQAKPNHEDLTKSAPPANPKKVIEVVSVSLVLDESQPRLPSQFLPAKESELIHQEMAGFDEETINQWANNILPLFKSGHRDEAHEKTLKILEKKPIPAQFRGAVWPKLIGNKQRVTKKLFKHLCVFVDRDGVPDAIKQLIRNDLMRTWAQMAILNKDAKLYKELFYLMQLFHVMHSRFHA